MNTSAVIISFNSEAFLPGALDSLLDQETPFGEIIIVDNRSADHSVEIIREYMRQFPSVPIRLLALEKNTGYAAGANTGICAANHELLLIANADILLSPAFNRQIIEKFTTDPALAMLSPLLLRFDGQTVDSAGQNCSRALHPVETGFNQPLESLRLEEQRIFSVCGAATVFRRALRPLLEIDGELYDEDFFIFWEDFDLGWRAHQLGLKIMFFPDIVIRHFRSATLTRNFWSRFSLALARPAFIKYHLVKNRILTLIKNYRIPRHLGNIPFIIIRDIIWIGVLTFFSPKIIIPLMKSTPYLRRAAQKRRELLQRELFRRYNANKGQDA